MPNIRLGAAETKLKKVCSPLSRGPQWPGEKLVMGSGGSLTTGRPPRSAQHGAEGRCWAPGAGSASLHGRPVPVRDVSPTQHHSADGLSFLVQELTTLVPTALGSLCNNGSD